MENGAEKKLIEVLKKFDLCEEEAKGINLENLDVELGNIECRNSLMGKIIEDKSFNFAIITRKDKLVIARGAVPAKPEGSVEVRMHSMGTSFQNKSEKELRNNGRKGEEVAGMIICMNLDRGEGEENSKINPQIQDKTKLSLHKDEENAFKVDRQPLKEKDQNCKDVEVDTKKKLQHMKEEENKMQENLN
ncbi:hypothetical protein ACH5RR_013407, partial [Cinchona calisaya]